MIGDLDKLMQMHGLLSLEFDTERIAQLVESVDRYVKAKDLERNILQINLNHHDGDVTKYTTPGIPLELGNANGGSL
jgi:hypothetical protein